MSRVEGGAQPDLASFTKLCAWLGVAPSRFFTQVSARRAEPLNDVLHHLYADPRLTEDAAAAIGGVLRQMYEHLASTDEPARPMVACHLRAAPVMRPRVPGRLGTLLTDLHAGLEELVAGGEL